MQALEHRLLNEFQRDFPLLSAPYAAIAQQLGTSPQVVLAALRGLNARGLISRVGPVFRPHSIGVSTLATAAVPEAQIEEVAHWLNALDEVNHNYRREHHFNLWFVLNAPTLEHLDEVLEKIETHTGLRVLSLPLLEDYHIDLGFPLTPGGVTVDRRDAPAPPPANTRAPFDSKCLEDARTRALIGLMQHGLPLVPRPFAEIAKQLGENENDVIVLVRHMLEAGVIKRLGVVVRHRELGYRANAMVVWDVPEHEVDALGVQLSQMSCVTLCYQRPRRLPDWPYNLFCMIHGKAREEALGCLDQMVVELNLQDVPRAVLFSTKRYKQRGACYLRPQDLASPTQGSSSKHEQPYPQTI